MHIEAEMKFIDHQELTVGGSTSIEIKFKLSEKGILWALISSSHKSLSKRFLKFWLKGPQYERKPVQSSISPTSLGKKKLCTISFSLYLHKQLLKHTCKKISAPYAYLRRELVVFESNKWFICVLMTSSSQNWRAELCQNVIFLPTNKKRPELFLFS